jgi:hypothetical protein
MLYVVRDPYATLGSLWAVQPAELSFDAFLTRQRIADWCAHVTSYLQYGVPHVRYEDLVGDHDRTLTRIAQRFDLPVPATVHRVVERVGWSPRVPKLPPWTPILRARVAEAIPVNLQRFVQAP